MKAAGAAPAACRLRVRGWASAPQWLQSGTKISPKNMTLREELIDDAIDCRGGNGKNAATRPQDGHADDASLRVDEGAAFSGRAEHKIHADEVVDSAAAKTVTERGSRAARNAPPAVRVEFGENRGELFDKTWIGMRVIISPNDAAPVEFSHPALFVPNAEAVAAAPARAETLAREAAEAGKTADEAKKATVTAAREAASLTASAMSEFSRTTVRCQDMASPRSGGYWPDGRGRRFWDTAKLALPNFVTLTRARASLRHPPDLLGLDNHPIELTLNLTAWAMVSGRSVCRTKRSWAPGSSLRA